MHRDQAPWCIETAPTSTTAPMLAGPHWAVRRVEVKGHQPRATESGKELVPQDDVYAHRRIVPPPLHVGSHAGCRRATQVPGTSSRNTVLPRSTA